MNTVTSLRAALTAIASVMVLAHAPPALAVCVGQFPAQHGEIGEMPCYPQASGSAGGWMQQSSSSNAHTASNKADVRYGP